jgi:hypothetical protein
LAISDVKNQLAPFSKLAFFLKKWALRNCRSMAPKHQNKSKLKEFHFVAPWVIAEK